MIYFDNAATSFFKPQIVKDSVNKAMDRYTANAGRGSHSMAMATAEQVANVRMAVSEMFNAEYTRTVFTHNCTTAINTAILGIVKKGDHIITTNMEHNSVIRPLHRLHKRGHIELTILSMNNDGVISSQQILSALRPNTRAVVMTMTSNVTGASNDIHSIGHICRESGVLLIVDAAQAAGHADIDMADMDIDVLCIAGHKGLFALQSIGCMMVSDRVDMQPIILGGTGVDSHLLDQDSLFPDNYESGTVSTPLIISLGAGVEYYKKNKQYIIDKNNTLKQYAFEALKKVDNIEIYSMEDNCSGVISFNIRNRNCTDVGRYLDEIHNICVRTGLHCAPLIHTALGTIDRGGAIRMSYNHKNTTAEIDTLVSALYNISKQ